MRFFRARAHFKLANNIIFGFFLVHANVITSGERDWCYFLEDDADEHKDLPGG